MDIQQNTTDQPLQFLMVSSTDHLTGEAGLSPLPSVTLSKQGSAFTASAGSVSEVDGTGNGNGWYQVAGNATDTNTLGQLILHATASGCDETDVSYSIIADNPQLAIAQQILSAVFGSYNAGTLGALLSNLSYITSSTIISINELISNGSIIPIYQGNDWGPFVLAVNPEDYDLTYYNEVTFGMTILPLNNNNDGMNGFDWNSNINPAQVIINNAGQPNQSITIKGTAADSAEMATNIIGLFPYNPLSPNAAQLAYTWTISIASTNDEYASFCGPIAQGWVSVIHSDAPCVNPNGGS